MRRITFSLMAAGLVVSIAASNLASVASDGAELEKLREDVLRLHILANSDSTYDQRLKLSVRDALLERSDEIFGDAVGIEQAEICARQNLTEIERIAEETLLEQGCCADVRAEVTDMYFDERVYGDITMPSGEYTALRIEIGKAQGRNWWCVMYPPLCIPAAGGEDVSDDKDAEDEYFDEKQRDIMKNPEKYEVRFAVWDKIKDWFGL